MAEVIPFQPGDNNVEIALSLGSERYLFTHRWNARDQAWYLDIREEDGTPISLGLKLVLGSRLGARQLYKPFWQKHILQLVDTAQQGDFGTDASFGDLGGRVQLLHIELSEFLRSG